MLIRSRITLLFTLVMFVLMSVFCVLVYSFLRESRIENMQMRLLDRAIAIEDVLDQPGIVKAELPVRLRSSSASLLQKKSIQVFNKNEALFSFSHNAEDTMVVPREILAKAREYGSFYFTNGKREAIAYYDKNNKIGWMIVVSAFDERGRSMLRQVLFILALTLTGCTVIAGISGYYFSKRLLQPVRKIADEVNIISAQNLAHRIISSKGNDEWHYLVDTLNNLLNRLQESFEIQRRFISSASHELSTPLTSISSQLEVSLQRGRSAEEYRAVMHSVYQDARHLGKLTQTLLEFATVSGTAGGIEIKPVRIDEVLMRLPAEISKMHGKYSVTLDFANLTADEDDLLVFGNSELLFTAMENIVSNACKYSKSANATVKLSVSKNEIMVAITDDGKGIPESELQNIFQPFYRTEDSRATTGFGVGLPLVNRIIKLHKGRIEVSSAVGKGTTFFVHLPIGRP